MKRRSTQLRPVTFEPFPSQAAGSVLISFGATKVLCTASIDKKCPRWIERDENGNPTHGWVTAEYAMLPGSTNDRKRRGPDGRSTEIQRLVGRSLRAAVDMQKMPGLSVVVDCDVLCADGGTRTAAITGGYVALAVAIEKARQQGLIDRNPIKSPIAAISVGIIDGVCHLDLDYPLDSRAEVDMNVVMSGKGQFIEVQGTGEQGSFSREELDELLDLASKGIRTLHRMQKAAVKSLCL